MLLAHDFHFGWLLEVIHRHHFAVIVERGDALDLSRADVDELVGVQSTIVVGDVERTIGENYLDEWIENAAVVGEIEAPLQRKPLSTANVSEPHHRARNARS